MILTLVAEVRPELKVSFVLFQHFLLSNVIFTELNKFLRLAQTARHKNVKEKKKASVSFEISLLMTPKYLT